ncbi:MAG: LysR family transcriptional regulator [Chloroflexi bacterium]|nr:LysR family transcriptional regulator [Chloroflexota bacterium]
MVDLQHLRCFVAVAEELHFRAAAGRLHTAQPHVSRQIRQLESALGVSLFHRTRRRVQLTDCGHALLGEARAILAQVEEAIRAVQRVGRGEIGSLAIGYIGAATHELLPLLLREFRGRHPDVELVLHELSTLQQVQALREGRIQVGFARPPIEDQSLYSTCLGRDRLVVALPEEHRFADQPVVSLWALVDESFITTPRDSLPGLCGLLMKACEQAGFVPKVVQSVVEIHTIISLVAAGIGVALVPASVQKLARAGVVYRALDHEPAPTIEVLLVWRRNDSSPVLRAFIEIVREQTSVPDAASALVPEGEDGDARGAVGG